MLVVLREDHFRLDRRVSRSPAFLLTPAAMSGNVCNMLPKFEMQADLTAMLNAWSAGDSDAREHLASIIYNELHHLARLRMFGERPGHMLNSSALVNEAFVRFMESSPRKWEDRIHFFAFMSRVMRQVLFDLARYRNAAKRSSEYGHSGIEEAENVPVHPNFHMFLDLDIALTELAQMHERQARVVELRYFGGLENNEIAQVLSVSEDTVLRDWRVARGWLYQRLNTPTLAQSLDSAMSSNAGSRVPALS